MLNPKIVPKIQKTKISDSHINSYLTNSESTCEVEGLINGWLGIEQLDNYKSMIKTLNDLFGKFFDSVKFILKMLDIIFLKLFW